MFGQSGNFLHWRDMKEADKSVIVQSHKLLQSSWFKSDPDCLPPPSPQLVKRKHMITISSDEEDEIYAGDADTKFLFPRENNIDKDNRFKCTECTKQFRDSQELWNHSSHHAWELYHCLKYNSISRSERSFYNNQQTFLWNIQLSCQRLWSILQIKNLPHQPHAEALRGSHALFHLLQKISLQAELFRTWKILPPLNKNSSLPYL